MEGRARMGAEALGSSDWLHRAEKMMRFSDKQILWKGTLSISHQFRHNSVSLTEFLKFVGFLLFVFSKEVIDCKHQSPEGPGVPLDFHRGVTLWCDCL